jgi:YwqJ-like deaminase/SUKH-3 immunity protein
LITRGDAALLVQSWADNAARSGGEWTPMLEEFELGYVVWVKPPDGVSLGLGASPRRVIDRDTGEVTTWGSVPADMVADQYRQHRQTFPAAPSTVDPVATIRRRASRPVSPNTAVHLMLGHDRRLRIAHGAKGDQELNHHPVVRAWLDSIPPGHLCRGAERHAEMIIISDVLHSYDVTTGETTSLEQARRLFRNIIQFERIRVRPWQSPPVTSLSCYSCVEALIHVGLFLPEVLDNRGPRGGGWILALDRPDFPDALRRIEPPPQLYTEYVSRRTGEVVRDDVPPRLVAAPPAVQEIARKYNNGSQYGSRPGEVHRVDDLWIRPSMRPLQELADEFGRDMSLTAVSIGVENDSDGLVVADERGWVFVVDQAGEWFLGADIDEAMVTLFYGREQRRVRDDRTW